jgi:hypothetical protein
MPGLMFEGASERLLCACVSQCFTRDPRRRLQTELIDVVKDH